MPDSDRPQPCPSCGHDHPPMVTTFGAAQSIAVLAGLLGARHHVTTVDVTSEPTPDGGRAYTAVGHRRRWWRRDVTATYTAPPGANILDANVHALATLARVLGSRVDVVDLGRG